MSLFNMDPKLEIILSILAYSFCSGTMLLLNKMTLYHLNYPSLVTTIQLMAALCFIYGAKYFCFIKDDSSSSSSLLRLDPIQLKYIIPYSYYIVAFSLGVYCNMKSLSISNVETVIVFKALSPCLVSFADALFLGREYPSYRSWFALILIVLGSIGYATQDDKFRTQGFTAYTWPFCYLMMISFEMAYGKKLLKSVDLKTLSGPVIYTNMLGIPPMMILASIGNEYNNFIQDRMIDNIPISFLAMILLFLSCAAGTGIGYSSWWCRGMVSATSFSLIGVMNKCLTILLNVLVWDQHASLMGIVSLFVCLLGGSFYRQAPLRSDFQFSNEKQAVANDNANAFDNEPTHGSSNKNKNINNHNDDTHHTMDDSDLERALLEDSPTPVKRRS